MTANQDIKITIICSTCGMEDPFTGCDLSGCTWRAEYVCDRIASGAPYEFVFDKPTAKDAQEGRIKIRLVVNPEKVLHG